MCAWCFELCSRVKSNERETNGNGREIKTEIEVEPAGGWGGMHIHFLDPIRKPLGVELNTRYTGPESLASRLSHSPLRAPKGCHGDQKTISPAPPLKTYTTFAQYMSFFSHWGFLFFLNVTILCALSRDFCTSCGCLCSLLPTPPILTHIMSSQG